MKKLFLIFVTYIVTLLFTANCYAAPLLLAYDGAIHEYNGKIYSLRINGETVDTTVPPVIMNDRALVPARNVFEKLGANVEWDSTNKKVLVKLNSSSIELVINSNSALVNNKIIQMDVPPKIVNDRTMIPARFVAEQLNMKVDWNQTQGIIMIDRSNLTSIGFDSNSRQDTVSINLDYYKNYRVFKLSNPSRIVIDFPNVTAPAKQQTMPVNGASVKTVRYAAFEDIATSMKAARVVLDVEDGADYSTDEKDKQLVIYISKQTLADRGEGDRVNTPLPTPEVTLLPNITPVATLIPNPTKLPVIVNPVQGSGLKNMTYKSFGDRISLILPDSALADIARDYKKLYTEKYELDGKRYIITFPSNLADIGIGKMQINDGYIDYIEVFKALNGQTSMAFNATKLFNYETIARYDYNNNNLIDTAITVLKPYTKADKLVVIDAGHGGREFGASSGGLVEKALNLDLALRLNELLKSYGVKTYMIRDDDSYVDLYERAYIANRMNAAMFVSIHNNAFNNTSKGTETLYNPTSLSQSLTNQKFAQIIQSKLISALGTYDRGTVQRPLLVVLRKTNMPAVLTEIGFLDNDEERVKLNTPEFRQKAAKAMSEGILQALMQIR